MRTGPIINLQNQSIRSLQSRREALVQRLPPLYAILRGSLIERYKPCGKPGCKCAQGPGHGPKYYLSISQSGARPVMDYVPQDVQQTVAQYLENFRLARGILDQICAINRELLRRRETL
jgi:hypothetical protein